MKLIVGFGNPESKYNFTRHNFGFLALDFYAKIRGLEWEPNPKFNAIWMKTKEAIFIKPQTYYNDSGKAVQAFSHYYKIAPEDIIVICDDFDLNFGMIRCRKNGSSGGNNGLKSTISELSSSNFARIRLGTNSNLRGTIGDIDFVLSKFTPAEKEKLPDLLHSVADRIDELIQS